LAREIAMTDTKPDEPREAPSDRHRELILDAMLEIAPESGWTDAAFEAASKKVGLSPGQARLACPNGAPDILEAFADRTSRAAGKALRGADLSSLKIREKVRLGVKAWLAALERHKAAVKRAAATPANLLTGPKGLWSAADAIWVGIGDTSTDANWYTKRLTLSAVLGSTLLCWAGTDDAAEVDDFLDRRIENVMQFEKAKAKFAETVAAWPDPLDILGKMRKS
jgi:ubiquinone biosynthesis protein COQ9